MAKSFTPVLVLAALMLSACGETTTERAATGGGIGAVAGSLIGLGIPGFSWWGGALLGAGAGAVIGAVTMPEKKAP